MSDSKQLLASVYHRDSRPSPSSVCVDGLWIEYLDVDGFHCHVSVRTVYVELGEGRGTCTDRRSISLGESAQ